MIICEWERKFHTALEFLMFVQNFCTVIACPWTEDESTKNMLKTAIVFIVYIILLAFKRKDYIFMCEISPVQ